MTVKVRPESFSDLGEDEDDALDDDGCPGAVVVPAGLGVVAWGTPLLDAGTFAPVIEELVAWQKDSAIGECEIDDGERRQSKNTELRRWLREVQDDEAKLPVAPGPPAPEMRRLPTADRPERAVPGLGMELRRESAGPTNGVRVLLVIEL